MINYQNQQVTISFIIQLNPSEFFETAQWKMKISRAASVPDNPDIIKQKGPSNKSFDKLETWLNFNVSFTIIAAIFLAEAECKFPCLL